MKQHINYEQLNGLSDNQTKKYWDWLKSHSEIAYDDKTNTYMGNPCMSIGQMIEFLDDDYINVLNKYDNGNYAWATSVCDALWEAVKKVLEKEEE